MSNRPDDRQRRIARIGRDVTHLPAVSTVARHEDERLRPAWTISEAEAAILREDEFVCDNFEGSEGFVLRRPGSPAVCGAYEELAAATIDAADPSHFLAREDDRR